MGLHAALAVHPASGHGAAARIAGSVAQRLRAVVDRLDLLAADTVEQSHALMRQSSADGLDALIVLGGDGAVHQGVQFCADTGVDLGIVPSGTGNDLARALDVPADPFRAVDAVVDALAAGRRRPLDLGRVDGGAWFGTVLCTGFDASVSERVNRMRWPAGPRRYDLAILAELAALRPRRLRIDTDHGRLDVEATLVAVGNTSYYGGGMPICPNAVPDDGLLDVTIVGSLPRRELVRMLPTLRTGRHIDHPAVRMLRTTVAEVRGGADPVYADGERLGALPVTVRCIPRALSLVR